MEETLPLFAAADIVPAEDISKSRKLLFDTNLENVKLMLMRGSDVPTYVEFGSADMGVAGKDLILEHGCDGFYEPVDYIEETDTLKVATKFTSIAKRYFAEQGKQVELIKLNGALELAPSLGLADSIVDIVDTGKTLQANGLEPRDLIADISSRVIVNKASMKIKNGIIREILSKLSAAVKAS